MEPIDRLFRKDVETDLRPDVPSGSDIQKGTDITRRIATVRGAISRTEKLADLLDKKFLDPLVGWLFEAIGFPIIGDIPTTIAGLYIVFEAKRAGIPNIKIVQMLANVGLDFAVDLIPIFGNIADFFVKSNVANVEIMKRYVEELERR
ncbi:DUF4112 domain-containing protein [Candidatus Peregrinibacteria bacterium]|nr:DUF4112 domain-containing protein [Candidatus Peregrinibacteria bacterium]